MARFDERSVGPSIEPGKATAEHLDIQLAAFQIDTVDVGDLQFATWRRLEGRRNANHAVVVKIKPGDCHVRFRPRGLFLDRQGAAGRIELYYAVLFRRVDDVA